jgi:4-hydroxymandelate oxidase
MGAAMKPTRRDVLISGGAIAAGSTFTAAAETVVGSAVDASKADSNSEPLCLTDFEPLAKAKIPPMGWEYMTAGAADELTLKWNSQAYQRLRLKPRILVDVSQLDTSIVLLGRQHSVPILLAPVASHKLYHPEGEIATARGASAADVTLVVTTPASTSLEDVAAAAKTSLWFQVYVQRDRGFTRALLQRAEKAGYQALCLTVDSPVFGARNREERAHVKYPGLPNLKGLAEGKAGVYLAKGQDIYSPISDPTVTWKTIEWMRSVTKLPIVAKGVLNPDDAELAIKSGVAAIIVSNHGGRNLDTLPPTIEVLPSVADKVAGRIPVLVDGGIRRGTDVLKALALGANAVLIGRPYIWGLGVDGEAGVTKVVNILRREFATAMALTGRTNIASIDRSVIWS